MNERDPNGISQHQPGAKLDAGKPRPDLILSGMPLALLAVAEVAAFGAAKYTEGGWQHVQNGVDRYTAAGDRHRLKWPTEECDSDSGLLHRAHHAWNALASLELYRRAQIAAAAAKHAAAPTASDVIRETLRPPYLVDVNPSSPDALADAALPPGTPPQARGDS